MEVYGNIKSGAEGIVNWCKKHNDESVCQVFIDEENFVYILGRGDNRNEIPVKIIREKTYNINGFSYTQNEIESDIGA